MGIIYSRKIYFPTKEKRIFNLNHESLTNKQKLLTE